ncbi:MAG: protein dehydratase [Rhodospirillales bacterium]|jgi:3-methylfumaryl-CoA hydratase|nr:protein dehydratase [Rhodospirillales bacterium]
MTEDPARADKDLEHLRGWIGRTELQRDRLTARLATAYRATLLDDARPLEAGEIAPPGIHLCVAPPVAPMSALGPDGHPARGGFLPPVPLPNRMWAGSRMRFLDDLRVEDEVERRSTVAEVALKRGRTGPLCFVTVEHVYSTARGEAVREEQDIVYRGQFSARAPEKAAASTPAAESAADLRRTVDPSPVLLFRYSALTFNGHRIHYDRRHAMEREGYAGLVVHGPLQAALLLLLASGARPDGRVQRFDWRGRRPLLDVEPILLRGAWRDAATLDLWTGADREDPFISAAAWL